MIYFLRHGSTDWNENLNSEEKKIQNVKVDVTYI